MILRESTDHVNDCYFCLMPSMKKEFNKKKKSVIEYPNIPSTICPVPHSDELPIPEPCKIDLLSSDDAESSEECSVSEPCTSRNEEFGRRRRLKGIHSRPDTNRTADEGLSFYYPKMLHCSNQMLAVMSLSQHRVSSSKTVRPRAPCGALCIGHAVSTWSAVCSEVPHLQFDEGERLHLYMNEWNRPTPVRRRLSLTQAARVSPSQQT